MPPRLPFTISIPLIVTMKAAAYVVALAGLAQAEEANPIEKIIQMIGDLETKIIKEGEDA